MSLHLPSMYLLPTNLKPDELDFLEESIPSLTWDVYEAEVVLGRITRRERALFELRRLKLNTKEIAPFRRPLVSGDEQPAKRQRISESETGSGCSTETQSTRTPLGTVRVVKLSWLTDSLKQSVVLPTNDYLLYEGEKLPATEESNVQNPESADDVPTSSILRRSGEENVNSPKSTISTDSPRSHQPQTHVSPVHRPALLHQTTSEHDRPLPPIPSFLQTSYSCQRPTPINNPNSTFIGELKEVRKLRLLKDDEIGVRAYSVSIAALAAYPYPLQSSAEVSRLPGCGTKIAELYQQFKESGQLSEVAMAAADSSLSVLGQFYDIWGVGEATAREFYNKGWRNLDDLVEYGWDTLSRVQQIGVKYYDEFQRHIPRTEVERIGAVILSQAHRVDPGFQMTIVGGYRRGKEYSGDVDVVVSHPDESWTLHLVDKIVVSLEKSKYITHTLTLSTRNSDRGQAPLPWRSDGSRGSGFDTLDKAMVVWQDLSEDNAPHRRVDIIVSPWKTVGCAILGWSGGTTFQRDLRRYCKNEKGLKFDSSGVRSRTDGQWVDLEAGASAGPAADMETAEKRVFEGLGLVWRPPEERCTG